METEIKMDMETQTKKENSMSVFFTESDDRKTTIDSQKKVSTLRESSRLRDKERINYRDEDDFGDFLIKGDKIDKDMIEEEAAAIKVDLNPYELGALEKKELLQFVNNPGAYLQIRNHILKLWQKNVNSFLTIEESEKAIQEKYRPFVKPAFSFLQRFGFINTGVISNPNPNRVQREERVVVIGAGMAGLAAARQLYSFGYKVTLLEARDRVGGRCNTDDSLGGSVDLGASIITGLEGNPLTNLCKQLNTKLHPLSYECPLYDLDGKLIEKIVDEKVEYTFNWCLDETARRKNVLPPSLGEAVYQVLREINNPLTDKEQRVFNWHVANLEYACAAELNKVSLHHWDQDDRYEWAGSHCLLREGYGSIARELIRDIDVKFNAIVSEVQYTASGVQIQTTDNNIYEAEYVVCALPLGVLKENMVKWSPPLPEWKEKSIRKLGFGLLNKVAIRFPHVFWNDDLDYFGHTTSTGESRGEYYLFWNLHRCMGKPVIVALAAGKAALEHEKHTDEELVQKVINVLSSQFGTIPNPSSYAVTRWSKDPFSRGSYSYIAVGSSGEDYDQLAKPVGDRLFFAGEATIKEHPATAAGAYLSGLRVAGMVDKACNGEIRAHFDVVKLSEEWKKERTPNKKARVKRSRIMYDVEIENPRRKAFKRIKKAKLSESYSWLFNSDYRIPKKKGSPNKDGNLSPKIPKVSNNLYNPQEFMKRAMDLLPKQRRIETPVYVITTPSLSPKATSPSPINSPKSLVSPVLKSPTAESPFSMSTKASPLHKQYFSQPGNFSSLTNPLQGNANSTNITKSPHSNNIPQFSQHNVAVNLVSNKSISAMNPPIHVPQFKEDVQTNVYFNSTFTNQSLSSTFPQPVQFVGNLPYVTVQSPQSLYPGMIMKPSSVIQQSPSQNMQIAVGTQSLNSINQMPQFSPPNIQSSSVVASRLNSAAEFEEVQLQYGYGTNIRLSIPSIQTELIKTDGNIPPLSPEIPNDPTMISKPFKQQISDLVLHFLTKYMKQGKISSKEDFKHLARKLTHQCIEKERKQGNSSIQPDTKKKIGKFIANFFSKIEIPYHVKNVPIKN